MSVVKVYDKGNEKFVTNFKRILCGFSWRRSWIKADESV
jgi:hypothetical protein